MPDMLVKLYELPEMAPYLQSMNNHGILVRRAISPEKRIVTRYVSDVFAPAWGDECDVAWSRQPVSCFIAQKNSNIVGFSCYDTTNKAFFGPTGVSPEYRGLGIGAALLLAALHAMYAEGYAYGIIGAAGPVEFYKKIVDATVIEGSVPGIYRHMLKN